MPRARNCRCGCGQPIPDGNTLRKAATIECSLKLAKADREKKERKELREDKARIKTRQQWLKEAQIAFNGYIRERDYGNACISCGRRTGAKMNAGHYRSVKASPETRFNPDNCHLQCEHCNSYLSGNIREYQPNLLAKIGTVRMRALEGPHHLRKYPIDELKDIKAMYTKMRRALEMGRL